MNAAPRTIEELVEQYDEFISGSIYKVSRGRVRPEDKADLKQAVYARVLETDALAKYDPAKGAFSTYLYWILRSVVVNQFARNARNPLNHALTAREPTQGSKPRGGGEDVQAAGGVVLEALQDFRDDAWERRQLDRDLTRRLEAYVARVQDGGELVKVLHLLYEGRTTAEVAACLGRTPAKVTLHRKLLRSLAVELRAAG